MPNGPEQHASGASHGARAGDAVGAVVTAFNPSAGLLEACRSLVGQVALVVVVDDGSTRPDDALLDGCAELGAVVVRHGSNRGIGAALNTGVREVRERLGSACDHVLTLDQDSVVPPGYVAALLRAGRQAHAAGLRVAMVGPARAGSIRPAAARRVPGRGASAGPRSDRADHPDHPANHPAVVHSREPIQSGLLVACAALDELGTFADELFIDGVDTDLYLRATGRGWAAVAAPGTHLEHALGQVHAVGGRDGGRPRLSLVHAAPFRYYYIVRNRVHLVRRHGRRAPAWAATAVLRDARHLLVTTALVPGRRARLAHAATGLVHGLRGVVGPRTPGR